MRLDFREDQQEAGNENGQHRSARCQWINAIDTSLAQAEFALPHNRRRGIQQRKPEVKVGWRPVQSPLQAASVEKRQDISRFESETPHLSIRKATAFAPIYKPLRFVFPSDISTGSVHGKRQSIGRHQIDLSGLEMQRSAIRPSSTKARPQQPTRRHHMQAINYPLAFRAGEPLGKQPHVGDTDHTADISDVFESSRVTAPPTGTQVGAANGMTGGAENATSTTATGQNATSKESVSETHVIPLQSKGPFITPQSHSKPTSAEAHGTFRPSSAVLQHPEILLGLLENVSEYRLANRNPQKTPHSYTLAHVPLVW